jgi:hypothetical protein
MTKLVMEDRAMDFTKLNCQSFAAIAAKKAASLLTGLIRIGYPACFKVVPIMWRVTSSMPEMKLLGSTIVGTCTACTIMYLIVFEGLMTQWSLVVEHSLSTVKKWILVGIV